MLLALDIGNSQIAIGLHAGDAWGEHWRISTDTESTADEYRSRLFNLMNQSGITAGSIGGIIISSVVPELTTVIKETILRLFNREPIIVRKDLENGLDQGSIPVEIGSDLLSNAAQAHHLYPKVNCMVIDFGTALTFTTVSSDGRILGVAIAPGVGTAVEALSSHTAQLPHVSMEMPDHVLGLNTVEAIQAGILYGYTGLVEKLIERTETEVGGDLHVIATGGFSSIIAPHIKHIDEINSWHTLDGLRLIYILNYHENQKNTSR